MARIYRLKSDFILVSHRTTPSHWLTLWRIAWSNSRQARLSRRRYRLLISSRSSREQPQSSVLGLGLVRRLGLVLVLVRQLGLVLLRQLGLVLLLVLVLLRQLGRQLGVAWLLDTSTTTGTTTSSACSPSTETT